MNFDNEFFKENKNDDIVRVEQSMKRLKNKLDLFKYKKRLKPLKTVEPLKTVDSVDSVDSYNKVYKKVYDLRPVSYYLSSENMNKIC